MAEIQARLNQIETEIARDSRLISQARARISAREEEAVSLRQQILVAQRLHGESFRRLERRVARARNGIDAMKCQACHERPDDARLNKCGHFYCAECFEQITTGLCERPSCKKRLERETEIDDALYEGLCTRFGVSFIEESNSEDDASDNDSAMQTPRASRFHNVSIPAAITSPQLGNSPPFQSISTPYHGDSSEDDGFDNRSQRSVGYGDDGDSFVSEDESIAMERNFETDGTGVTDTDADDEDSMLVDSESDGVVGHLSR